MPPPPLPPEPAAVQPWDAQAAWERAGHGYEFPDGQRVWFAFNHLALCRTLGIDTEGIAKLGPDSPKWANYDDDMMTVLFVATLGEFELGAARLNLAGTLVEAHSFFDRRGVRDGSAEYDDYERVFRTILRDAVFSEPVPETEDDSDETAEEDGGEGAENFPGEDATSGPEPPSTLPTSEESGPD